MTLNLSRLVSNLDADSANGRISIRARDTLRTLLAVHHGTSTTEDEFVSEFHATCLPFVPTDFGTELRPDPVDGERWATLAHQMSFVACLRRMRNDLRTAWTDDFLIRSVVAASHSGSADELGRTILDAIDVARNRNFLVRDSLVWLTHAEDRSKPGEHPMNGFVSDPERACLPFHLGLPTNPRGQSYVAIIVQARKLNSYRLPTVVVGDPFRWKSGGRTDPRSDAPTSCATVGRTDDFGNVLVGLPEVVSHDLPWSSIPPLADGSLAFFQAAG